MVSGARQRLQGLARHPVQRDGPRGRTGERISTGVVASTVKQVVRKRCGTKQPRQGTNRAAQLLLQRRVKTLNHEWAPVFRRWSPDFPDQQDAVRAG
jgi:hypothetical protein